MSHSLNDFVEILHEFEIDLNSLVILNHGFTMESIDRAEQADSTNVQESFAGEDDDVMRSQLFDCQHFYENLRRAARNMTVVGLVTRLEHWIGKYIEEVAPHKRNQNTQQSKLVSQLGDLESYLGTGPVPIAFFDELVIARHSVIHAD